VHVSQKGPALEQRIFEKERQNPRFAFLFPQDPYHSYYQKRLGEFALMSLDMIEEVLRREAEQREFGVPEYRRPDEQRQVSAAPPKEPEPLEFLLEKLPPVSVLDYDVMKLAAQYVARNGRGFMLNLTQKEQRNPQFEFLRPHHSLHGLFLRLVTQYTLVLQPDKQRLQRLGEYAHDHHAILGRVMQRTAWTRYQRDRQAEEAAQAEREREAFAAIDWQDFVIVEAVDFTEADRVIDLSRPLDLKTLSSMPLTMRTQMWTGVAVGPEPVEPQVENEEEADMDMSDHEDQPLEIKSSIKVRQDYVPKARQQPQTSSARLECPLCRQQIAADQFAEHVRIETIDPKWKTQRESYLAKHRETNLVASGSEVARNLALLMQGDDGSAPTLPVVAWDGYAESIPYITRQAMDRSRAETASIQAALKKVGDHTLDHKAPIGPKKPPTKK